MKNYHITKLFFWTWYRNFAKAISQQHLCLADILDYKLQQHSFFNRVKVEVFPSYQFWIQVQTVLDNYTANVTAASLEKEEEAFLKNQVNFLKESLVACVERWRFYPQMFRDFWVYYPRYGVSFDNVECIYLDFYFELPKVIDSLLSELLIRDVPLRAKISADPALVAWEASGLVAVMGYKDILPPIAESKFSEEALSEHIVNYFSGEEPEKAFFKVISFYLDSRLSIKNECVSVLEIKGLPITETSLIQYFVGEYIFKGVSNEAKRFFVANSDLMEKNPFKKSRENAVKVWASFTEEEQKTILKQAKKSLERAQKRFLERQSLTVSERQVRFEAAKTRILESDFNSFPRYPVKINS